MYEPEQQEERRRAEEREMVRQGTELWRARKEQLLRQKRHEQSQLRRMLTNYWPWGRAGAGAPCAASLRKRNIPLDPPTQQQQQQQQQRCPLQFPQVRRRAAGLCVLHSAERTTSQRTHKRHRVPVRPHTDFHVARGFEILTRCEPTRAMRARSRLVTRPKAPPCVDRRLNFISTAAASYTLCRWLFSSRTHSRSTAPRAATRTYRVLCMAYLGTIASSLVFAESWPGGEPTSTENNASIDPRWEHRDEINCHCNFCKSSLVRPPRSSSTRALVRCTRRYLGAASKVDVLLAPPAHRSRTRRVLRCIGLVEQQNNKPTHHQ
ncbi:unnamed protein product [Trichogramma brassicae]|uniref:Uncharacterized protein n=1 Tax=Trichogramma brassicae TaxID=86971 RepID=A0A6H5IK91_9HYME|nr:unnamed protein product [Trichogramma brassicae]